MVRDWEMVVIDTVLDHATVLMRLLKTQSAAREIAFLRCSRVRTALRIIFTVTEQPPMRALTCLN
jgi:hypothetical protein